MSDDIDLFTDALYESKDFGAIDTFLRNTFDYVSDFQAGPIGMGISYLVGYSQNDTVKLDLFYTDTLDRILSTFRAQMKTSLQSA